MLTPKAFQSVVQNAKCQRSTWADRKFDISKEIGSHRNVSTSMDKSIQLEKP